MYAYQMDVEQPIEMYDTVNAALAKAAGGTMPLGLLMHMATEIPGGFRITEVWDSHERCDQFGDEVRRPMIQRILGEAAVAGSPPPNQELRLHNLQVATPVATGV